MTALRVPTPAPHFPRFAIIVVLAIVVLVGYGIYTLQQQKQITLEVNGSIRQIHSDANTVAEVLEHQSITLDEADWVEPSLDTRVKEGMTIVIIKAHQLALEINGDVRRVYTHQQHPLEILTEQGVILQPNDQLYIDYRLVNPQYMPSYTRPPSYIRVIRAKYFRIYDNDSLLAEGYTTAATVGDLLDEYQVALYLADTIVPPPHAALINQNSIRILRSNPVLITVDGQVVDTRVRAETVQDVLNTLGLALSGEDYSIPSEDSRFQPNMNIEVVRVTEQVEIEQANIPYPIIIRTDPTSAYGERTIVQAGVAGLQETWYRIRRENAQVVSRIETHRWLITVPIPEIIQYGTAQE
ncbi:MAG: DUF348 domain-containing protein [Anaerolineales bacterium]|nr:DUF348 domain-containing protein [Anaerolineales bacterium]